MLIAISGIDGAGKTSLARSLARATHGLYRKQRVGTRFAQVLTHCGGEYPTSPSETGRQLGEAYAMDFVRYYERYKSWTSVERRPVFVDRWTMCVVAFSKAFSTEPEMVFDDLKSIRVPDISILIDISVDLAIERILHRGPVALDETPPILAALRAAYLGCAHIDHRVYVIDGSLPKKRMLGEALVAIDMRRQQILDKEVGAKLKSL